MVKRSVLLVAALASLAFPVMGQEIKKICLDAKISSFKAGGIYSGLNVPGTDYCIKGNEPFPVFGDGINRTIKDLGVIHQKVADLFGVDIHELFSEPVRVGILGGVKGATESKVTTDPDNGNKDILIMSVDTYWKGGINEAVYTHELMHLIARRKNHSSIPRSINEIAQFNFTKEMLSDLLAYKINKRLYSYEERFPKCFSEIRTFSPNYSYKDASIGFFQGDEALRFMYNCCKESRELYPDNKYVKDYCKSAVRGSYFANINPIYPMDFTLDFYTSILQDERPSLIRYDIHRLGLPILSFLINLEKALQGKSIVRLLFKTLEILEEKYTNKHVCYFQAYKEDSSTVTQFINIRKLFPTLKSLLSSDEQSYFDYLWDYHGMDIVEEMTNIEEEDLVRIKAAEKFWPMVRENQLPEPVNTICREKIELDGGYWYKKDEDCYVVCE